MLFAARRRPAYAWFLHNNLSRCRGVCVKRLPIRFGAWHKRRYNNPLTGASGARQLDSADVFGNDRVTRAYYRLAYFAKGARSNFDPRREFQNWRNQNRQETRGPKIS